jgi:ABC-type transport system involved in multi-copper enzyme maturation permease subunit
MSAIAPAAPTPAVPAPDRTRDGGSFGTVAAQMFGADFLKLRRKRWLVWLSLFLTLGIILIVYVVLVIQHASNPEHGPAGGVKNFREGLDVLTLLFGPLAAILIGVEAGTGDASGGVFRELVVTGRSRVALFATRVPAALAFCWSVVLAGFVLLLVGAFVFASSLPTPDASLIFNSLGFALLSTGVLCVIAVGLASLTTSRPGALATLIAWQIIASPVLASISSLGSAREWLLSQAIVHFTPVSDKGGHGATVTLSQGMALLVLVVWVAVFLALGAWRTRTMDA